MRRLLTTTIVLTYLLIIFGATVRAFGAGLACPDWPLCHGQWIPPFDLPVLLEWGHRLVASVVGVCTLAVMIFALTRAHRARLGWLAVAALALVIVQAVLGGLTVLKLLHFSTVTLHLATGLLFLGLLVWMRLRLTSCAFARQVPARTRRLVTCALGLVYMQSILGALVSSNYAGLACPDFPTCNGRWIPPLQGLVAYHFVHRAFAFVALGVITWAVCAVFRHGDRRARSLAVAIGAGTVFQLGLGITNVLLQLPPAVTIAHTGLAAALFAALVMLSYRISNARLSPTHQTPH